MTADLTFTLLRTHINKRLARRNLQMAEGAVAWWGLRSYGFRVHVLNPRRRITAAARTLIGYYRPRELAKLLVELVEFERSRKPAARRAA